MSNFKSRLKEIDLEQKMIISEAEDDSGITGMVKNLVNAYLVNKGLKAVFGKDFNDLIERVLKDKRVQDAIKKGGDIVKNSALKDAVKSSTEKNLKNIKGFSKTSSVKKGKMPSKVRTSSSIKNSPKISRNAIKQSIIKNAPKLNITPSAPKPTTGFLDKIKSIDKKSISRTFSKRNIGRLLSKKKIAKVGGKVLNLAKGKVGKFLGKEALKRGAMALGAVASGPVGWAIGAASLLGTGYEIYQNREEIANLAKKGASKIGITNDYEELFTIMNNSFRQKIKDDEANKIWFEDAFEKIFKSKKIGTYENGIKYRAGYDRMQPADKATLDKFITILKTPVNLADFKKLKEIFEKTAKTTPVYQTNKLKMEKEEEQEEQEEPETE